MTIKSLTSIAAATGVATGAVQLFWSLASGSYSAGSRMESLQTDIKLLRNEVQNQNRLFQAQSQIYEFRLTQLEEARRLGTANEKNERQ